MLPLPAFWPTSAVGYYRRVKTQLASETRAPAHERSSIICECPTEKNDPQTWKPAKFQ